ncbi:MAG: YybH family protein [Candidatus Polarisedimenticolia bacterium]
MPAPRRLLLAVLLVAAGAACGTPEADEKAIRTLLAREIEAVNRKDLSTLSEVWAKDDGILLFDVGSPGRFQGWGPIGRQWKEFFDRFTELRLGAERIQVEVSGDLGFATYDWTLAGRMGDYALEDRGQATAVYRDGRDGWRLVHAHFSPAPAGSGPASEAAAASGTPAAAAGGTPPAPGNAAPTGAAKPAGTPPG